MEIIIKIKIFVREHFWIVFLAVFLGIISSVPQYLGQPSRPGFRGVYTTVSKDTIFYQARAKDVIDGHPFVTNPYLAEHKSGAPMQFWIPDYILAKPIGWFGISVPAGFIIWTFFLTAILALLSYAVLLIITESKKWSVLGVLLLHLGLFALKFIRLPPPGLNFIFWLLVLLFALLFLTKGKKVYVVGSALSFGMIFNIYPYYWTFYVTVFAVFTACTLLFRMKDVPYKKYALIFGGGLLVGIPYFIFAYMSTHVEGYAESLERLGVIHTRFPSGISTVVVGGMVIVIFILAYMKRVILIKPLSVFLFAGTLAGIIVMNQHLITGRNGEFSSHYDLGNMFWFAFSSIYVLNEWFKGKSEKVKKTVFVLACLVTTFLAFRGAEALIDQQITYRESEPYIQNYRPIFDWLSVHSNPEDVVYANGDLSTYIPIYTKQNVYYAGYSILFFMTDKEVHERFIINNYFEKFTDEFVRKNQRGIFGGYYVNEYGHNASKNKVRKLFGMETVSFDMVPLHEVDNIKTQAQAIQKNTFEQALKAYKADYVVWDSIKNPNWKVDKLKSLERVYEFNGIIIYKIN